MRVGFGSGIALADRPGRPGGSPSLRYAQQFGATDIVPSTEHLPSHDGTWPQHQLIELRVAVAGFGMKLSAIENVPISFYDHIMLNGPRRDEQIEKMITNCAAWPVPAFLSAPPRS